LILSDRDIRAALQRLEDPLIIDPAFPPERLQPASLELTLGPDILFEKKTWMRDKYGNRTLAVTWEPLTLCMAECIGEHNVYMQPGDFWLASTVETVRIPTDLVAQVNGKSSWARKGLIVHTTAGFIDPGFKGQITLELKNVSSKPIGLHTWAPICQLVFTQLTSPALRPYGSEGLGSHYQGQVGPTPAQV
jgi:dCTP deaminase